MCVTQVPSRNRHTDLDLQCSIEKQVAEFQVAMYDALGLQVHKSMRDLGQEVAHLCFCHASSVLEHSHDGLAQQQQQQGADQYRLAKRLIGVCCKCNHLLLLLSPTLLEHNSSRMKMYSEFSNDVW
jgi:hypothetical protein